MTRLSVLNPPTEDEHVAPCARPPLGASSSVMPIIYGSPDLLPTLSVVYVCRCGLRVGEYGAHAGEHPPRWVRVGEGEYLCEHCAALAAEAGEKTPERPR